MRNVDELVYMFGSFLPSQRKVLLEQAGTNPALFHAGLQSFVSKWARADWLEEYNVERVGEWIAKHCPATVRSDAEAYAKAEMGTVSGVAASSSIRLRAYKALLDGMQRAKQLA